MRRLPLFLIVCVLLACPARSGAETVSLCDASSSDDYLTKTSAQFLRGTSNIGFCWLEMIHQPAQETKNGGHFLVGIAKGIGHSFLRLVQGVGDVATCASPHRDKEGSFPSVTQSCALGSVGLEDR